MRILVYDVAAESGGVLTILNEVYKLATTEYAEHTWHFMLSVPKYDNTANTTISNYPQVKKGWLNRLYFDKFCTPKIIKDFAPDIVLNLQNICVKSPCKQIIYMQQPLPFSDYKFSFSHKLMWVYQNIIGAMIKKSCKKCDEIIVQTEWIKQAIIRDCKVAENKITIKAPCPDLSKIVTYVQTLDDGAFFFPASGEFYKNHQVVVSALKILKKQGHTCKVIFTLLGNENAHICSLKKLSDEAQLDIEWKGKIPLAEVYSTLAHSTLIFPSFIETFGLPLLEARTSNAPIIASITPFAQEILQGYDKVQMFEKDNADQLAAILLISINNRK